MSTMFIEPELKRYYETFAGYEEADSLIDAIGQLKDDDSIECINKIEYITEKFGRILDHFQEQPHLIDDKINQMLTKLFIYIYQKKNITSAKYHTSFKFIYHITKVRGYKIMIRYMPHETSDLPLALQLLSEESPFDCNIWQTRYVLLLWLSLLVNIPFNFAKYDSGSEIPLMERLFNIFKQYLTISDNSSFAAAIAMARFLIRPDVSPKYFQKFFDWSLPLLDGIIEDSTQKINNRIGVLLCLAYIFKLGRREDVSKYALQIIPRMKKCNILNQKQEYCAKLLIKIYQWCGLSLLKSKLASWRYHRGRRTITYNLFKTKNQETKNETKEEIKESYDEDDDGDCACIPDEIEDVIVVLMDALRHQSHIARYSAAKGIGRITNRLSKEMGSQIVTNILEMLHFRENDSAWHGSFLALAELARRGMILPDQLNRVIERIKDALFYDQCRGNYSVGDHVRDAACFVLWAFARAFEPSVIKPYVFEIAPLLVTMALFDREIQCRRAASAAFQEHVGRQGVFPHGIEILTTIDNIAVSQIRHTFLELSMVVAEFDEYLEPMICHLLQKKINHWDREVRELSAEALANLSLLISPQFIQSTLYPKLISMSLGTDINSKHGSIIGLGYVINALSEKQLYPGNFSEVVKQITISVIECIGSSPVKHDLLKHGLCIFILKLSTSSFDLKQDQKLLISWYHTLNNCIYGLDFKIREHGVSAFVALCSNYFNNQDDCDKLAEELMVKLKEDHEHVRCAALHVLSLLPNFMISLETCQKFVTFILNYLKNVPRDEKFLVNLRSSAIDCTTHLVSRIINEVQLDYFHLIEEFINYNLQTAIQDYTQTIKGDVALIIRIASINSLKKIVLLLAKLEKNGLINQQLVEQVLGQILVHSVSSYRKLRMIAFQSLEEIVNSLKSLYQLDDIAKIISSNTEMDWNDENSSVSSMIQVLNLPNYTYFVWKGLLPSFGSDYSVAAKPFMNAIFNYLKELSKSNLVKFNQICDVILKVFIDNVNEDRLLLPLINSIHYLVSSGLLNQIKAAKLVPILQLTWNRIKVSRSVKKKLAGLQLFSSCLRYKELQPRCLDLMTLFLSSSISFVRRTTSDLLYTSFLTYGDVILEKCEESKQEQLLKILSDCDWDDGKDEIKKNQKELRLLLGLE